MGKNVDVRGFQRCKVASRLHRLYYRLPVDKNYLGPQVSRSLRRLANESLGHVGYLHAGQGYYPPGLRCSATLLKEGLDNPLLVPQANVVGNCDDPVVADVRPSDELNGRQYPVAEVGMRMKVVYHGAR